MWLACAILMGLMILYWALDRHDVRAIARRGGDITVPYHLDVANDWTMPVLYGLVALGMLIGGWTEYRYGASRRAPAVR